MLSPRCLLLAHKQSEFKPWGMVDAAPAPAPPLSSLGLCEGAFYERRGSFADGPTPRPMAATAQELTAADQVSVCTWGRDDARLERD